MKFVHSADWQLGMRRHFLDGEAQGRFAQDRLDAVAAVGRLAAEHDAAFVAVTGDVFEHNQVDRRTVRRALDVLRGYPDIPVLLLPGNHDPYDAGSVYRTAEFTTHCPAQVQVLTDATPVTVDGVEVVGAPWRTKRPLDNPAEAVLAALEPASGAGRVLLAHGGVDELAGAFDQAGLLRLADLEAAVADGRVGFVALGDRHSATAVGRTGRVWYAGAPEPTDYDEDNPGAALVVELDGDEVAVTEHRVGRWTFRRETFELAGAEDVARVRRWLDEAADKPRTVVKIGLRGTLTLRDRQALEALLEEAADTHAAVERWERHTEVITAPDEADLEQMQVSGFVASALAELREAAADHRDGAGVASDALALLYREVTRS